MAKFGFKGYVNPQAAVVGACYDCFIGKISSISDNHPCTAPDTINWVIGLICGDGRLSITRVSRQNGFS